MFIEVKKVPSTVISPAIKTRARVLPRILYWSSILLGVWGVGLTGGCAGPSQQVLTAQALSQVQAQKSKQDLQQQLIFQAPQSSLSSYKDYQVGPEDLIEVEFFGNDELGREVRVNGQGEVSLPLIGGLKVEGLSPKEIEAKLAKLYKEGRFIRNPQITVMVKEYRHQRVMVTGAVVNPGSYEVIGPRTLLEMLGKAGGLVDKPEMKAGNLVYVTRHQNAPALMKAVAMTPNPSQTSKPGTVVIDLRRLLSGEELKLNIPIQNGDVIYVPPARMAFVLGAVKKPGQVPVKDNLTVTQAIAVTEGQDPLLSSNRITILRFDDKGERITLDVNLKGITSGQEPDPLLKENDIVFVHESGFRRFFYDFRNMLPGSIGLGGTVF
jgi:polysaccharide export outer membrane protein